jgi:hypothetical protein
MPLPDPSTYNIDYGSPNDGRGFLSTAAQALGSYIQNKPDQFAITADALGSNLAPNNAFAGIGGMLGRSSIASKATNEAKKERQDILSQILAALTEGNKPGGNKVSFKMGPEGRLVADVSATVNPSALKLGQTQSPDQEMGQPLTLRDPLHQQLSLLAER